jgi:hypothetical protein
VNVKQLSISSYSDLSKLSSDVKIVHFRKFISRRMVDMILGSCRGIKKVSLSRYASEKCNSEIIDYLTDKGLQIHISNRGNGRPNLLERTGV